MLDGIISKDDRAKLHLVNRTTKDFRITSMSDTFDRRDKVKDSDSFENLCNGEE